MMSVRSLYQQPPLPKNSDYELWKVLTILRVIRFPLQILYLPRFLNAPIVLRLRTTIAKEILQLNSWFIEWRLPFCLLATGIQRGYDQPSKWKPVWESQPVCIDSEAAGTKDGRGPGPK